MPDCNNCIWSTRDGRCVEWNCDFVSHDMARKMLNTVRSTARNNAYTMAAYNSLRALREDGENHDND